MTIAPPGSPKGDKPRAELTAQELLDKLRRSLAADGDFPASAKLVNELRGLALNPKTPAHQVTEVILKEPSLGTRVLAMVNSAFYRRIKPIMTVSQAVQQIGMKSLAELCSGLILMQKFVPLARREGPFATCLQKTILTSLLASTFSNESAKANAIKKDEEGYLAGSFAELGTLLLAFYFPKIFETAVRRAKAKNITLANSIKEITGLSALDISLDVLNALNLPESYREILLATKQLYGEKLPYAAAAFKDAATAGEVSKLLFGAQEVSQAITSGKGKAELDNVLQNVKKVSGMSDQVLGTSLSKLPAMFTDHCAAIEISLPALPEYIAAYSPEGLTADEPPVEKKQDAFTQFVEEVRLAVDNREPTASVITSVMETLAWGLNFDRVLLLLLTSSRRRLGGRMMLGSLENFEPREFERPILPEADRYAPDAVAFAEGRTVFNGDPLLENGWPIAAIPIGFGQRAIGVIYADRTGGNQEEVPPTEQAAIGVLAELLDRSILMQSEF